MDNTKGIKVHDTVWVDMSNWSGIPPHESGYAVVDDFWGIPEYDKAMYRLMYAVKFRGSDDVIIVNGRRVTPINEDEDTQEDTMHDKHYRDSVVEPILVMQALFSHDEFIGFLKGNILKYRLRAGHKGGDEEMKSDLDKIHVYEEWLERAKKGERI
nr:MAG TPA: nucelotide kinase [Bacteriophage sp.]